MYLRNPAELLDKRAESAVDTKLYFQVRPLVPKFHPMSAAAVVLARKVIEKHIKCFTSLGPENLK